MVSRWNKKKGPSALPDMTGAYASAVALRADIPARVLDFLARKQLPLSAGLEAFWKLCESTLSTPRLKSVLQGLLKSLRREEDGVPARCEEPEWQALVARIQSAGPEGTIESYPLYLFTVDQTF